MKGTGKNIFQIKRKEDGRGPYAWRFVISSHNGLRQGSIYRRFGSELNDNQVKELEALQGYDVRRVA